MQNRRVPATSSQPLDLFWVTYGNMRKNCSGNGVLCVVTVGIEKVVRPAGLNDGDGCPGRERGLESVWPKREQVVRFRRPWFRSDHRRVPGSSWRGLEEGRLRGTDRRRGERGWLSPRA